MINIKDIVILDEAIYDLEYGKEFYDKNEIAYIVAILPMRRNPVWITKQLNARS